MSDKKNFKRILNKLKLKFSIQEDTTDHYRYKIVYDGIVVMYLNQSHSIKDNHYKLWGMNLYLGETDTKQFIECSLSIQDYINRMKERKVISNTTVSSAIVVPKKSSRIKPKRYRYK